MEFTKIAHRWKLSTSKHIAGKKEIQQMSFLEQFITTSQESRAQDVAMEVEYFSSPWKGGTCNIGKMLRNK